MSSAPLVIVGASLAGASAARGLREGGHEGPIVLLGAERHLPYERPALSKAYLAGTAGRASLDVHDRAWYDKERIDVRVGTVASGLDLASRRVRLASGGELSYEKLLLATGSTVRKLRAPGADLDGVHYLRGVEDADALAGALSGGGHRVVVIGGGWIGLETAAAARSLGNQVTVVEAAAAPLQAVLGRQLGEVFAQLHRDHGVTVQLGSGVRELRGKDGRVTSVVSERGDVLPADVVIAGIGVTPNTALAASAGLGVDNGVLVDASLRTSHPDVYAAGDVANAEHLLLGRRLRVEHWANARSQGAVAGAAMLGEPVTHDAIPYFFSDQYELGMEYTGYASPGDFDQIVYRGDLEEGKFTAFWLAGDRIVAGMNVNVWDVSDSIAELVRHRTPVEVAQLADPDVPLHLLMETATGSAA